MSAADTYDEVIGGGKIKYSPIQYALVPLSSVRRIIKGIPKRQLHPDIKFILRIAKKHSLPETVMIEVTPKHWSLVI